MIKKSTMKNMEAIIFGIFYKFSLLKCWHINIDKFSYDNEFYFLLGRYRMISVNQDKMKIFFKNRYVWVVQKVLSLTQKE